MHTQLIKIRYITPSSLDIFMVLNLFITIEEVLMILFKLYIAVVKYVVHKNLTKLL